MQLITFICLCFSLLMGTTKPAFAAYNLNSVKIAYVYNIAKFTRWPDSTWPTENSPFLFCVYGKGEVIDGLQALQTKQIDGHPIELLRLDNELAFDKCNALYIDSDERSRYRYILSLIDPKTVLTISDGVSFLHSGGLITLVEGDQRVRFQVNMEQLSQSILQFSSKMLKLAILVDNPT